jgi:hypothetical protein
LLENGARNAVLPIKEFIAVDFSEVADNNDGYDFDWFWEVAGI